jgi:hypothetical protein
MHTLRGVFSSRLTVKMCGCPLSLAGHGKTHAAGPSALSSTGPRAKSKSS